MPEQKINVPLLLLALTVIGGGYFLSQPSQVGPGPLPPEPDIIGVAKIAADDGATFLAALGENCKTLADQIGSGSIKTTDAAHSELKRLNDASRLAAFKPWHAAVQAAIDKQDMQELAAILRESAQGFPAAIKGR